MTLALVDSQTLSKGASCFCWVMLTLPSSATVLGTILA